MSHGSHDGMSRGYMPIDTGNSANSSENEKIIRQIPNPSSILLEALPDSAHVNPRSDTLSCPVLGCSLVFKGKMSHGYLWRHLGRPGVRGLTGDEKAVWQNLHRVEHDRLLATRSIILPFYNLASGVLTN